MLFNTVSYKEWILLLVLQNLDVSAIYYPLLFANISTICTLLLANISTMYAWRLAIYFNHLYVVFNEYFNHLCITFS